MWVWMRGGRVVTIQSDCIFFPLSSCVAPRLSPDAERPEMAASNSASYRRASAAASAAALASIIRAHPLS